MHERNAHNFPLDLDSGDALPVHKVISNISFFVCFLFLMKVKMCYLLLGAMRVQINCIPFMPNEAIAYRHTLKILGAHYGFP